MSGYPAPQVATLAGLVLFWLCLSLYAWNSGLAAQVPSSPHLSLTESLNLALQQNLDLAKSRMDLLQAKANVRTANQLLQTSLAVNAEVGESTSNAAYSQTSASYNILQDLLRGDSLSIKNTSNLLNDTPGTYQLDLVYTRPLLKGGGFLVGHANIDEKERSFKRKLLEYDIAEQSLALNVISNYFTVLKSWESIAVSQNALNAAQASLERTQKLLQEALTTKVELGRAQMQYYQSENYLIQTQKTWKAALDKFKRILGSDPKADFDIYYDAPLWEAQLASEDDYIAASLQQRKELKSLGLELAQKKADLALARNRNLPQINLAGEYHVNPNLYYYGQAPPTKYGSWSVGAQTIFSFNDVATWEAVNTASRNLQYTEQELEQLKLQIKKEVRQALLDINQASEKIKLHTLALAKAEESLAIADTGWREGIIDNRDVLEAQNNLFNTQEELKSAKIDYILGWANLEYISGNDLIAFILKLDRHYEKK